MTGSYQLRALDHRVRKVMQAIEADPSQEIQDLAQLGEPEQLAALSFVQDGDRLQPADLPFELASGKSRRLLQSTEMPIKEVSYSVGYRHAPSFVRAFRNKYASSPNDYRNQQRLQLSDS